MRISLTIYDMGIPDDLSRQTLELPDRSTVEDMAVECVKIEALGYDYQSIIGSTFVVSNSLASLSTVLSDGDKVVLMRPLGGG